MTSNAGASPHVQVPASIPNYDVSDEGNLGAWESIDPRSGVCAPGTFNVVKDWPSDGEWVQA
jgi:hypothetical protein